MITEKAKKDLELACEKIHKGITTYVPAAEEAMKEMAKFDKEFKKLSESVRRQIERGARRTTHFPL